MSWESILKFKITDDDTLFMSFSNLEELLEAMLKNNRKNAKSLNHIYENVKSGKINKNKQKEYLMNFRKYVTKENGLRKQWDKLVSQGKF